MTQAKQTKNCSMHVRLNFDLDNNTKNIASLSLRMLCIIILEIQYIQTPRHFLFDKIIYEHLYYELVITKAYNSMYF